MDSNNIKTKATGRSSNIELLRIFAMVMILVYHGFHQLKHAAPDSHLIVYFYTVLGNGVPLFLLISGFFSVNLNAKKLIGFYLYCAIWNMICYVIGLIFVHEPFGLLACLKQLLPFSHPTVWYPPYYFWLMLFAPLLNTFCRNTDTKRHGLMVVGLYLATVYFGLVWQNEVINNGRSVVYFVYMYLLGAFCRRLYDKDWTYLKSKSQIMVRCLGGKSLILFALYLAIVALATVMLPSSLGRPFRGLVSSYQSPILPITSLIIFGWFLKFKIHKKWINYIASSVFGVYLMHENPYCRFMYRDNLINIYQQYEGLECASLITLNMLIVFVIGIIIDKIIREPIQKPIQRAMLSLYTHVKNKIKLSNISWMIK